MSLRAEAAHHRRHRRFWSEARRVARELGVSVRIGAQVVREDDQRWRRVVRDEATPAIVVREIRRDVEGRAVRS